MLGIVSLLTDASSEMIYPLIPIFVTLLGSGVVVLGVIEGMAETTASLIKFLTGIWSDKMRKKKVFVLIGYGISGFARPLIALVTQSWQIVFVRMLDRLGKGIRTAPRDALIADCATSKNRGRCYGFHRAMDHTGAVIGPIITIILLILIFSVFKQDSPLKALRLVFGIALIPGILAYLAIQFFVKDAKPAECTAKPFKFSFKDFDKGFLTYLFIVILFTLGNSSDAFLLFRIEEAMDKSGVLISIIEGIKPLNAVIDGFAALETKKIVVSILMLPLVWGFFHIVKAVFSIPFSTLSDRIGRKTVISIGWGIYALVYASFAFLDMLKPSLQPIAVFILFTIYALYYAFTEGTEKAYVADFVKPEQRGSAFGLFNLSIGIGALPASIIFGLLYKAFSARVAFLSGAILASISIILLISLVMKSKE